MNQRCNGEKTSLAHFFIRTLKALALADDSDTKRGADILHPMTFDFFNSFGVSMWSLRRYWLYLAAFILACGLIVLGLMSIYAPATQSTTANFWSAVIEAVAAAVLALAGLFVVTHGQARANYLDRLQDAYAAYFSAMAELRVQQRAYAAHENRGTGTRNDVLDRIHAARLALHRVIVTDRSYARAQAAVRAYWWPQLSDLELIRPDMPMATGHRATETAEIARIFLDRDEDVRWLERSLQHELGRREVRFFGDGAPPDTYSRSFDALVESVAVRGRLPPLRPEFKR